MSASLHFWFQMVTAAARASFVDLGSNRAFWLFLLAAFGTAIAFRAYRAPERKRWSLICTRWASELRDVIIVTLCLGVLVFAYELMWNQPNIRSQQTLNDSHPIFSSRGPICIQVLFPHGFGGGSYKLPYKPIPPSPPTLYDNGSPMRKGIDYSVSDGTVVVNYKPATKDSLWVMYTTDSAFLSRLPESESSPGRVIIPFPLNW